MTDIQASVGIEQIRKIGLILKAYRRIAARYRERLAPVRWLGLPAERNGCRANWQSYPVIVRKGAPRTRDGLMQYLLDNGVATRRGVMNAHQEKPYANSRFDLKNSEGARDSVILLPIFFGLKNADIKKITELIKNA
jgi:dTDP-4-amino-4,6-dideoxygalactose transaminase